MFLLGKMLIFWYDCKTYLFALQYLVQSLQYSDKVEIFSLKTKSAYENNNVSNLGDIYIIFFLVSFLDRRHFISWNYISF